MVFSLNRRAFPSSSFEEGVGEESICWVQKKTSLEGTFRAETASTRPTSAQDQQLTSMPTLASGVLFFGRVEWTVSGPQTIIICR